MSEQVYMLYDFETYSECDLKRCGAHEYARHPSTEVLCVAWKTGTKKELAKAPIKSWWKGKNPKVDFTFLTTIYDPDILLVAHNAQFEFLITNFFIIPDNFINGYEVPIEKFVCTAAMAAALALPRNLEGASNALDLFSKKDMDGNRLIKKWCKPRKPSLKNKSTRWDDPEEFKKIVEYCKADVRSQTELFLKIPELTPRERQIWLLDQKINNRGFYIDRPMVGSVLDMIETEIEHLDTETVEITGGDVATTKRVGAVLEFIQNEGYFLPNLQAKTIKDALLEGTFEGPSKRLLEIRQEVSKTSTAKYKAFEMRSRTDSRVRGGMLYHGASTGRWAGAGVQPQNFPRGSIKDTETACDVISHCDLELIRLTYGNPMEVFSSCLRSVITASPRKELFVSDFASIETRVLFWIAKHEKGLKLFRENKDLYIEMAASIYNKKPVDVDKIQRQLGKTAILGLGYQMGSEKFHKTCQLQNIEITEELAKVAVTAYRTQHRPVVDLWGNIQRAALSAIMHPKKIFALNFTKWWVAADFLWCELPSGRRLAYYKPEIKMLPNAWGENTQTIYHWATNPVSKKWESVGTYGGRLTENIVQAVARDLLAESMLRIEKAGYEIILTAHDEVVAECSKGLGSMENFNELMSAVPDWAKGCPIKAEGFSARRYRK